MEGKGCNPGLAMDSANPLLRAVHLRRLRLTRLLLEGGAYINESDNQGQTPLMVACRTQYTDAQSTSRVKLVQFLLEKGADPNIQDKDGFSALMHALWEKAGPDVVSLLLANGADASLEDHSGTSALVHAVMAGDWKVLKLLLDTCKAKGKEVIIITTDKFPCGELKAKQHLSTVPLGVPDQTEKIAPGAPASPSDIQLITSPQCTSSSLCPPAQVFSFKDSHSCGASSHPGSPSRYQRLGQSLLRLNSEPHLKIPTSHPHPGAKFSRNANQSEDVLHRIPKLDEERSATSTHTFNCYEERLEGDAKTSCARTLKKKLSLTGLLSSHSASHPNLHSGNTGAASSSLRSIIQRRRLGRDIYSSDPQLALESSEESQPRGKDPADAKRLAPLSTTCSTFSTSGPCRRVSSMLERRGSGAFLLDHNSQARPRSLPPLTLSSSPNNPVLSVYKLNSRSIGGLSEKDYGPSAFLPCAPPGAPRELSRRMLLRRHSIQTEQLKTSG